MRTLLVALFLVLLAAARARDLDALETQSFLAEARTRISIMPQVTFSVRAKDDRAEMLSASFGRRETADYELLLQPRFDF